MPRSRKMLAKRRCTARLCDGSRSSRVTSVTRDVAAERSRQPVVRCQRQLDAAGAAADDREAHALLAARPLDERLPAPGELGDRLDRDRVLGGARHVVEPRR